MKFKFNLLLLLSFSISISAMAQTPPTDFSTPGFRSRKFKKAEKAYVDSLQLTSRRFDSLKILLDNKKNLLTWDNYNMVVKKSFRSISGTEVKGGKVASTSAVVDEKSVTVNIAIKPDKEKEFYILPTVGGSSDKSFVTAISDGKYARTLSVGTSFIWLPRRNSSKFHQQARVKLHNDLRLARAKFEDRGKKEDMSYIIAKLKVLDAALNGKGSTSIANLLNDQVEVKDSVLIESYQKAVDTLMGARVLPPYFSQLNLADQRKVLAIFNQSTVVEKVVDNRYLNSQDAKQLKAAFNSHRLRWFSLSAKFNDAEHDVLDLGKEELTRSVHQGYFSGQFAFTFVWAYSRGHRFYISPTLSYSNEHDYSPKSKVKAQVYSTGFPGGAGTVMPVKEIEYYPTVSQSRLDNAALDLPVAWYNNKINLGLEIGSTIKPNDPDNDKLSARIGLLLPINPKSESQLMLQPMLRFTELNDIGRFWKKHVVLGVNLSVNIPKGLFE